MSTSNGRAPRQGGFHGLDVVLVACLLAGSLGYSQVIDYRWPPEASVSDLYRAFVRCGNAPEREVQVLLSRALHEGDYRAPELAGRTFSFVPLSFGTGAGPVRIRVVKRFGDPAAAVSVSPRRYAIIPTLSADGREAVFEVAMPSRYLSVHFQGEDNRTAKEGWIRHMLCIFVDPLETDVPAATGSGAVVYGGDLAPDALRSAATIIFPSGYHNLRRCRPGGIVAADGQLLLQDRQALYLQGGAFVEGIVANGDRRFGRQRVYGRGILSARQYLWRRHPEHAGPTYGQILEVGNHSRVDGITLMESPHHGIVGWTTRIENLKYLGWHCNNDAVRVGTGSEISHSFIRAVDDHFYNFKVHVHDVVLWAGHNGAILTYGWGGEPGSSSYRSGGSLLESIDVIHPEWTGLGNNNGLVAAQVGLDYRPYGYGGDATTVLRDIRIEGTIPGLVHLKPRSVGPLVSAVPVAAADVGYLGDLVLDGVHVDGQSGKGRLEGKLHAATDGERAFLVRNVLFRNVRVGTEVLSAANCAKYLDIAPETTCDIRFEGE